MRFFKTLIEKRRAKKEAEKFNRNLEYVRIRTQNAFMSPSFRAMYNLQHEFLPSIFYKYNNELIGLLEEKGFEWIINEFNKISKDISLVNSNNTKMDIKKYTNNKVIVRLHTGRLDEVVTIKCNTPLCNSIFFCFDLSDPNNNMYLTAEIDEYLEEKQYKYLLCGKDKEGLRFGYGSAYSTDIGFEVVEEKFKAQV